MIFTETKLKGAFLLDIERNEDERGFFARTFCQSEFQRHGLTPVIAQASVALNQRKGTIRGMHFQLPPSAETKLIRCTRGALLDVIIDLRPESPSYLHHVAVELTAANYRALYVPERFAHGYQTLSDDTEALYDISAFYDPSNAGGLLYSDPQLGLSWPLAVAEISLKDRSWKPFREQESELKQRMMILPAGTHLASI